jgi:hypothetical protein
MKASWGSGCIIHVLLISGLVGVVWSASRSGHFTPGKEPPPPTRYPLDRKLSDSRVGLDYKEREFLDPTGTRTPTPRSTSPQPVAISTALFRLHLWEILPYKQWHRSTSARVKTMSLYDARFTEGRYLRNRLLHSDRPGDAVQMYI